MAGSPPPDNVIARLVHDLRNPLNTISMNVELVSMEASEEASRSLGESLSALERAVGELERGLEAIETIVDQARAVLVPGGVLALEHGYTQAEDVRAILAASGFVDLLTTTDLAGRERVSEGRRPRSG